MARPRGEKHDTGAERRIGRGLNRMGGLFDRLLTPSARRRGFATTSILGDWPSIVGPELAARARPVRIAFSGRSRSSGGVLHLQVSGAAALELQHSSRQILERINSYFGRRVVARLHLVHYAPRLRPPAAKRRLRTLEPAEEKAIDASVAATDNDDLRQALGRLGRAMSAAAVKPAAR